MINMDELFKRYQTYVDDPVRIPSFMTAQLPGEFVDGPSIKDIKSISNLKKILIHFNNYDLLLFSKDYSHLLALRDYLYLFKEYEELDANFMLDSKSKGGLK